MSAFGASYFSDDQTVAQVGIDYRSVWRDGVSKQRQSEDCSELIAGNINTLLQGVANASIEELDILIIELQTLSLRLNAETARVQREIASYAAMNRAAMRSAVIIGESLWKSIPRAHTGHVGLTER